MTKKIGEHQSTMTMDQLKKSGLKIKDSKKVNLKYKCLKVIDAIIEAAYSPGAMKLMQKQGYSVEKKDIDEAKKIMKLKMVKRHLDGKSTKELTGVMSKLRSDLAFFDK